MSKRSRKAQVWIGNVSGKGIIRVLMFKVVDVRGGGWHPVTGGVDEGESFLEAPNAKSKKKPGLVAKMVNGLTSIIRTILKVVMAVQKSILSFLF